jgi:LPXTG-motif cell wall-anchored protein
MKKLILAFAAVAFIGFGGTAVSAATDPEPLPGSPDPLPIECTETDVNAPDSDGDGIPNDCVEFYVAVQPPTTPPATTTTTVPVTVPPGQLPRTGSGVSPILGIGALLFVGGGIIVVASRRRTGSTPA